MGFSKVHVLRRAGLLVGTLAQPMLKRFLDQAKFWRPFAVVPDEVIGNFDQLSYRVCHNDYGGLSLPLPRMFTPTKRQD